MFCRMLHYFFSKFKKNIKSTEIFLVVLLNLIEWFDLETY
jgi:hypothetical protein